MAQQRRSRKKKARRLASVRMAAQKDSNHPKPRAEKYQRTWGSRVGLQPSGVVSFDFRRLPLLVAVLGPVAFLTLGFLWNEDVWWYLASGEQILNEGGIPQRDPFLARHGTNLGFPSHSWLFTVVVALAHRGLGLFGVQLLAAMLAMALATLLFLSARVDRFGVVNALFTTLVLVSAAERLSGKSELVSWLLLVIYFYVLERDGPFDRTSLSALVILQLVWANLHSGYLLGIAIVLAYTVGGWTQRLLELRGRSRSGQREGAPLPPLWLLPVLLLVSLLAPSSLDRLSMIRASAEVTHSGISGAELSVSIDELLPTFQSPDSSFGQIYLIALATGGLAVLMNQRSSRFLPRLFFLAGMAFLAYTAIRHVTGLTCAAALVGLVSLEELTAGRSHSEKPAGLLLWFCGGTSFAALTMAASGLWLLLGDLEVGQSVDHHYTLNPMASSPGAADYLLDGELVGPLFNDQSLGGYLIHRLYPGHRPFIDNRIWNRRRVNAYTQMSLSPEEWERGVTTLGFHTVVLTNLRVPSSVPLRSHLASDPDWRMVYFDPTAVVFVRSPGTSPLDLRFDDGQGEVPFLTPEAGLGALARRVGGVFFRTQPEELLHQYLSVLGRLRRISEVDRLATAALELRSADSRLYRDRGSARMMLGKHREGVDDLQRAVRIDPADPWNHYSLALALRDFGERNRAARAVDRALRLEPGNDRFVALQRELSGFRKPPMAPMDTGQGEGN